MKTIKKIECLDLYNYKFWLESGTFCEAELLGCKQVTENEVIKFTNSCDKIIVTFRLEMYGACRFEYYEDEDTDKLLVKALEEKNITLDEVYTAAKKLQEETDFNRKNIHLLMEKTGLSFSTCADAYVHNEHDLEFAYNQLKQEFLDD